MKSEEDDDENSNIDVCCLWNCRNEEYLIIWYNLMYVNVFKNIFKKLSNIFWKKLKIMQINMMI